jgi:hypothetical protein
VLVEEVDSKVLVEEDDVVAGSRVVDTSTLFSLFGIKGIPIERPRHAVTRTKLGK